jgi:Flp pilus assembly protein TadG
LLYRESQNLPIVTVQPDFGQDTLMGRTRSRERGFILMTMGLAAVATIGAIGLSVDLGRMFIAKNETQAYCDAAALAAALKLDGESTGIAAAQAAVDATTNRWNLGNSQVASHTVEFATSLSGPWEANPSPAAGYMLARVRATVPVSLYFLPLVVHQTAQNVTASAVAGQIVITSFKRGLGPFTAVSTDPTAPNYGLVEGNSYDILWPAFTGVGSGGCSLSIPTKCFQRPPCSGEPETSLRAVVEHWQSSTNGYWGSTNTSEISQEILDLLQLSPVAIGEPVDLTNGVKNAIGNVLDDRVNADYAWQNSYNSPDAYDASPNKSGRRIIPLPIVQPTASGTIVVGYGRFLLQSNKNGSGATGNSTYYKGANGNEAFCAVYAGSYVQGSATSGGSATPGAYRVALVQ